MLDDKRVMAWKDSTFRDSLSAHERETIGDHPSGDFELTEIELAEIVGASTQPAGTDGCCSPFSKNCGTCGNASSGCCSGGS